MKLGKTRNNTAQKKMAQRKRIMRNKVLRKMQKQSRKINRKAS